MVTTRPSVNIGALTRRMGRLLNRVRRLDEPVEEGPPSTPAPQATEEEFAIPPTIRPEVPVLGELILETPEQARGLGFEIPALPEGWRIQLSFAPDMPDLQTLISPEGERLSLEDVVQLSDGQLMSRDELERRIQAEAIFLDQFTSIEAQQVEMERLLRGVFPLDRDIPAIIDWVNANPEQFLETVRDIGRTEETEALLTNIAERTGIANVEGFISDVYEGQPFRGELGVSSEAVLQLEPEWESIRTGEVITESEKAKRFPLGHEIELDEWRLTTETAKNYTSVFKVFGESLTLLPKQLGAAVLQAFQGQGGASVVNRDWADQWIEEASTDQAAFASRVAQEYGGTRLPISLVDLAELPQNMAFSLTSMGAGLAVGVPIALAPVPGARVAAWTAGTLASGAVAYNMSTYQIMQSYLEIKNAEMQAEVGRGLTAEEEKALKKDFSTQAMKYGLWEAVPEALSNLAFAKLLTMPLGKMVGRNIATQILSKITGIYGQEFLTETITQKGQSDIEVESGLREGRISWVEAFKEIAPQTFLLTTILGGLGQVGVSSVNKIKQSLKKEIGEQPIYDAIKDNITGEVFAEVEAESQQAIEEVKEVPPAKPIPEAVPTPAEELAEREARPPVDAFEVRLAGEIAKRQREIPPAVEGVRAGNLKSISEMDTSPEISRLYPELAELRQKRGNAIDRMGDIQERGGSGARYAAIRDKADADLVTLQKKIAKEHPELAFREAPVTPQPTPEVPRAIPVEPTPADVEVIRQLDELTKMHDIWSKKLKTSEETKVSLAKYVRENLPPNVRGKFITSVAKVKTDAQLQEQMAKVKEVAELNAQKILKVEIRKEIKKAQATVKDHILKGKFTPDVQRRLDVLTHNLDLDRDIARDKMSSNIQAFDEGNVNYEDMLQDNELLNFAGIEGMSSEELADTLSYIKILESVGRSERQAKQEAATERINVIRSDISGILTGGRGLKTGIGAVPRAELAAKPSWLDTFVNWQYGIDNLADKLSKLDPTSQPFQSELSKFVTQVHRATNRQVTGTKEAYNNLKDIIREVYGVKSNREVNQVLNGLGEEVNLGTFELTAEYKANNPKATTVTIKMTRDELIAKHMQMQDSTLNNTFTTGMGWSPAVREAVDTNLTEQERKLSEALFVFYEEYYTATNEIYGDLYNVDLSKNPDYSPIRRDFEGDIAENVLTLRDASQYASVLNGSLKARQRNIRPLRFNGATAILSNHIEQMEHFKAWATTMRDMRRVFGNKEIRQAIEQYHGVGISKLLDTFMNQMARGGVESAATNSVADFLRRNFTKSILAIKPVIALKQIPSLFAYISEMNVSEFFSGTANFWTAPIKNFRFLLENSEGFRSRIGAGFERDIRAAMAKHGKTAISGRGKFTDWFLLQIRLGDTFAVTQGMWAKYKAGLKQGLTQEEAIAAAEDTTNRTQPSFGIDTLSAIQNGGSWLKLMTMFQNQPNKYFRIMGDNLRNFKYGRGSRAKAASTLLLTWVLLPMMFQFIADAFQWKPERQARAGILGPLNFILIGGQLVQSMWGWITDQPFDYQVSPVAQTGRDLQMIFLKAKKLIGQHLDPYKDISVDDVAAMLEYIAKATGQVTGLPTPYFVQVEKLIRSKLAAGEEIEIKDFLFSQWALQPPAKNAEEKVADLNFLLGVPKEGAEDKPLTDKEIPFYTTKDWFRDIGKAYSKVLPRDVLDDSNTSKESKAWAQYEIARSQADILPNVALYRINTEDNADTIINYYEQWKARERIESLPELIEFDKLYPKAYLGNVTRQQYDVLKKYLEAEDKDGFLDAHPALRINPRNEWLENNPTENAYLALGGQAKILSKKAYDEFNRLVNELDIPEDAIPALTLPPEGSVENYFKYNEMVDEFSANSWEVQLIVAQDEALRVFLGREPIDTPVRALELKIKHRDLSDLYDSYSDSDSSRYIEDDVARDEARDKLRADNPAWVDDMRRVEAIENEASDTIVESWVERGKVVDEFGGGSSEAKVWLIDNPEAHQWALDNELLTDNGSDWNEQVLRANLEMRGLDEESDEFRRLNYKQNAFQIDFPEAQIDTYVDWYMTPRKGYEDDWFLMENVDFYQAMLDKDVFKERDFSKVPSREVFALFEEYNSLPLGGTRLDFRRENLELDAWLVLAKGYTPVTGGLTPVTPVTGGPAQDALERLRALRERLGNL